jgi:hypothetical protein
MGSQAKRLSWSKQKKCCLYKINLTKERRCK